MRTKILIVLTVVVLAAVALFASWFGSQPNMYKETYKDGTVAFLYFPRCDLQAQTVHCRKNIFWFPTYHEDGVKDIERLVLISDN